MPVILVATKSTIWMKSLLAEAEPKLSTRKTWFYVFPVFTFVPWASAIDYLEEQSSACMDSWYQLLPIVILSSHWYLGLRNQVYIRVKRNMLCISKNRRAIPNGFEKEWNKIMALISLLKSETNYILYRKQNRKNTALINIEEAINTC